MLLSFVQFEVVSKEEQPLVSSTQPLALSRTGPRLLPYTTRPPRPAVRLSSHPYQPARQSKGQQQQQQQQPGADQNASSSSSADTFQPLPLLPLLGGDEHPWPQGWPATQAFAALHSPASFSRPGSLSAQTALGAQNRAAVQPQQQLRVSQSAGASGKPLDGFTEQLQADLGGVLADPPLSPFKAEDQQVSCEGPIPPQPHPTQAIFQPSSPPPLPASAPTLEQRAAGAPRSPQSPSAPAKPYQPPVSGPFPHVPYPAISPPAIAQQQQQLVQERAVSPVQRSARQGELARDLTAQARGANEGFVNPLRQMRQPAVQRLLSREAAETLYRGAPLLLSFL